MKTISYIKIGQTASLSVFVLGVFYLIITVLGFLSLKSPQEQIPDPFFTMMEIMSILISLSMAISLTALFFIQTSKTKRMISLVSLLLMYLVTCITSCVHFVVLSFKSSSSISMSQYEPFFSFKWPSVVYALDILAWDWFYALSILSVAFLFGQDQIGKVIRILLFISAVLSLVGLLGVPLENMNIRNIGIIGYAVIGPFAFLLIGKTFMQYKKEKIT